MALVEFSGVSPGFTTASWPGLGNPSTHPDGRVFALILLSGWMATVIENRERWTVHEWVRDGHEWSPGGTRAGSDLLWWRSILPRLHMHLPVGTLLEIAPGFGRWTHYLTGHCARLIGVDITERCLDICRERFASRSAAEFHLNDGESLPMVADASIDLAFSFDSLVHVEAPQIRSYLRELARTLKPGGAGFIHHSNLAAYADPATGAIPSWVTKRHWRAESMSAAVFREACRAAGLACVTQEVINWIGRGTRADRHRLPGPQIPLTDCISVIRRPDAETRHQPTRVYVNRRFVEEWRGLHALAPLYARAEPDALAEGDLKPRRRLSAIASFPERARSYAGERWTAHTFVRREPIVRALGRGVCPDCGGRLAIAAGRHCRACHVSFTLS